MAAILDWVPLSVAAILGETLTTFSQNSKGFSRFKKDGDPCHRLLLIFF